MRSSPGRVDLLYKDVEVDRSEVSRRGSSSSAHAMQGFDVIGLRGFIYKVYLVAWSALSAINVFQCGQE